MKKEKLFKIHVENKNSFSLDEVLKQVQRRKEARKNLSKEEKKDVKK
jgi:hypothetical protein